ncbi:MAG: hypothetical protein IJK34_00385 [Clostridia bacterium]|nr:hypothetical protein [Clostridia bacterium]
MNRKLKVLMSLLIVFLFAFQLCAVAFAQGNDADTQKPDPIRYTNIDSYNYDCYISGLKIYANASLTAKRSMYLSITIELQKLKSGDYEPIESWSDSKTGITMSLNADRLINLLATYRIKVTFNAGGETVTAYAYP